MFSVTYFARYKRWGKLGCGFVSVRGVAFMQDRVVNGVCCPTKKLGRLIGGKPFVHKMLSSFRNVLY